MVKLDLPVAGSQVGPQQVVPSACGLSIGLEGWELEPFADALVLAERGVKGRLDVITDTVDRGDRLDGPRIAGLKTGDSLSDGGLGVADLDRVVIGDQIDGAGSTRPRRRQRIGDRDEPPGHEVMDNERSPFWAARQPTSDPAESVGKSVEVGQSSVNPILGLRRSWRCGPIGPAQPGPRSRRPWSGQILGSLLNFDSEAGELSERLDGRRHSGRLSA